LVVVVAAGNDGPATGTVTTPAIDPLVLTVGAADEAGTSSTRDDVIPTWSSEGPTADGVAKPDIVAPGRKIVSVRVPGSTIDQQLPTHIESPQTIRLSGTSEATGVAAGAAALLAAQGRQLSPDDIKALLTSTAVHLSGAGATAQGNGEINVGRAAVASVPAHARQTARPAEGMLRLLLAMGPAGLADALHVNWDHVNWDHVNWDDVNWDHVNWDHVNWDHVNWDHVNWDQTTLD
jgi:serine protease AprX